MKPGTVRMSLLVFLVLLGATLVVGTLGAETSSKKVSRSPIVTFIELGSVNCVPCRAMRPVMADIETSYGGKVKVLFYDVWTKEGEPFGRTYGIRVIPTQVFLDKDGREFFRHEGFIAASEIKKLLKSHGVTP
jgi:thioredoxin 1